LLQNTLQRFFAAMTAKASAAAPSGGKAAPSIDRKSTLTYIQITCIALHASHLKTTKPSDGATGANTARRNCRAARPRPGCHIPF
jgi:hypothetical protein